MKRCLALCLFLCCLIGCGAEAIPTGSWGLSFHTEGQAPTGNSSKAQLAQYDAVYLGDESQKRLYLTFDAGYENGCMEEILAALEKHGVPACFFLVGNYMEQNADLVRKMVQQGHIVGNHTYHHYDMSKLTDKDSFRAELDSLEELYLRITGKEMTKFYRPPQGIYSEENLRMAQEMGYKTVFWSLAYVDWYNDKQPTREEALSKLIPRVHDGAVILLHSTSRTNATILDELLTRWKNMGYTFGTVEELFSTQNLS